MADRGDLARENFLKGYNCAQAVFLAFSDLIGFDERQAMRMASSFGGGMGRMREVCGTVSASLMVLGLLHGYDACSPTMEEDKKAHYARVQEFAARFRAETGTIICREILADHAKRLETTDSQTQEQITAMLSDSAIPTPRTEDYYKKRPCAEVCATAARILEEYLKELQ